MPDFNFTSNFPIAGVADLYSKKPYLEALLEQEGQKQLVEGMKGLGTGVQSAVDRRQAIAQALAQANILKRKPELQETLGEKEVMLPEGVEGPRNIIPGTGVSSEELATALRGLPSTNFLSSLQPTMTEDIIPQKDAAGNIIGFTKVSRSVKGKTLPPSGPQPTTRPPTPLSPDRAEFQIIDKFNSNPQVRKQQQSLDGASAVRELALSDNPIAAASIPTYMARASGEVGALSEPDKRPFGGSRAILEKLEAALIEKASGKLSDENRKFLIDLSDIMERNANENLDRHGREVADQYSKTRVGLDAKTIFSSLRPNSQYKKPPPLAEPESKDVLKVGGTFNGQIITGVKLKKP